MCQSKITLENNNLNREGFTMLKRWLENRNAGKTFVDYFHQCGCKTIAIYDAGEIGRLLYGEIKNSDIEIKYFIDRNAEGLKDVDGIPVILLPHIGKMEEVDILVVSPIVNYEMFCKAVTRYVPELRTLPLRDAVYEF